MLKNKKTITNELLVSDIYISSINYINRYIIFFNINIIFFQNNNLNINY